MNAEEIFSFPRTGAPPWEAEAFNYAGWVPTISGHLSFSLVGSEEQTSGCKSFNQPLADHNERVVIVHKQRRNRDRLRVIPRRTPPEAKHDFFLVGVTAGASARPSCRGVRSAEIWDQQGVLTGVVLVVPGSENPDQHRQGLLDFLFDKLACNVLVGADEQLPADVMAQVLAARDNSVVCLALRFALFRTGELRFWFDNETMFGAATVYDEIEDTSEFADAVAEQAYFFVKEAAHLHYHHPSEDDQLLPLVRLERADSDDIHHANELKWRRETLWGLARIITQFRRRNRPQDQTQALGVLAYADVFQNTQTDIIRTKVLDHKCAFDDCVEIAGYDFSHTKASVEAAGKIADKGTAKRVQTTAILIALSLSFFAILQSSLGTYLAACKTTDASPACTTFSSSIDQLSMLHLSLWMLEWPLLTFAIIFVLGLCWTHFGTEDRKFTDILFGSSFGHFLSRSARAFGVSASRKISQVRVFANAADWLGRFLAFVAALAMSACCLLVIYWAAI